MVGMTQVMMGMGDAPLATLQDHTITGTPEPNDFPPPAYTGTSCFFRFNAAGTLSLGPGYGGTATPAVLAGEWLTYGSAADCELFVTATSGTPSGGSITTGALDTWQAMTTNLQYGITTGGTLSKTTVLACQVRDKNTLAVLATCSITLSIS
jgi:hypothetical protein